MERKDSLEMLDEKLKMHEHDHDHNDIDFDNVFHGDPTSPENLSRISSIFSNNALFDYS